MSRKMRKSERRPRWATALLFVGVLLVLAVSVLHLTGAGPRHGLPDSGSAGTSP